MEDLSTFVVTFNFSGGPVRENDRDIEGVLH